MKPEDFVTQVVDCYTQGRGIFANKINAEELIPKNLNPLKKSQYIFYVLQLDYAMKSQILYKGGQALCKLQPDFFTPISIKKLSDDDLGKQLKENLHPRYINEAVKRYRHNTAVLMDVYLGDPRKIFTASKSCTEILTRLKAFRGFGPKIGNFFVRTMINTFKYDYADIDLMLPPVDIHDVRIAYLMGYTKTSQMTEKNITFVKRLWRDACLKAAKSWLVFDKALWLLGSEGKPKDINSILKLLN